MKRLRITVENRSYDVTVEDLSGADSYPAEPGSAPPPASVPQPAGGSPPPAIARQAPTQPQAPAESGAVTSPMAGTILTVLVKPGDTVSQGKGVVVLEAMKMENQIAAPAAGTVKSVEVAEGDTVTEGQVLVVLE